MEGFNWKKPDYRAVFEERNKRLHFLRQNPEGIPLLKRYYKTHIPEFISDWGMTIDPRMIERGKPAVIPFVLFPMQVDWIHWILERWRNQEPGISEKSRDSGLSWLAMAFSCSMCLFYPGMAIGFGSRKEEYCDKLGSPKTLLEKGRIFMGMLPPEFRGTWDRRIHAPFMRINFPDSGSIITAEAGDNIGRGDRTSIYFIDESAFLEHPQTVDAALSQTTNCRQDISSANGMANTFYERRFSGKIPVFTFHWRSDPRKDDEWYEKQKRDIIDPVIIASEIDIDYAASVAGVVIRNEWIRACIDAHKKLSIRPTGRSVGALDVADEGKDQNAFAGGRGILLDFIDEWSGKGGDIFATVEKSFTLCDINGYDAFYYDADGVGAGVRGDARIIAGNRRAKKRKSVSVDAFRGSATPDRPDAEDVKGRTNADFFANCKAQGWWSLRTRFQKTYRWITEGQPCSPDDVISIASTLPMINKVITELSQPTYSINNAGKIVIDKQPDGVMSPNLADAVMIRFASIRKGLRISSAALSKV